VNLSERRRAGEMRNEPNLTCKRMMARRLRAARRTQSSCRNEANWGVEKRRPVVGMGACLEGWELRRRWGALWLYGCVEVRMSDGGGASRA